MRINSNLYPKSGYRFKQPDGTIIVGPDWNTVIAKVIAYRKRNNLPFGDPDAEVNAQACQNNPSLCREDSQVTREQRKIVSLKGRVLNWFSNIRAGRIEIGDEENMRKRANICALCPKNISLPDGCAACRGAVKEVRKSVIGSRPVDERIAYHGCIVLGFEPATAAWIDSPTVENSELPPYCWRKRL